MKSSKMLNNKESLGQYLIEGGEQKGWNHSARKAFFVFFNMHISVAGPQKSHRTARFMACSRQQSKQKLRRKCCCVRFPLWNKGDLEVDLSELRLSEYTDIMSKENKQKTTYNQNLPQLELLQSPKSLSMSLIYNCPRIVMRRV